MPDATLMRLSRIAATCGVLRAIRERFHPLAPRARRTARGLARAVFVGSIVTAALLQTGPPASAQVLDESLWVANGTVYSVVHHRGTIYIGGDFTQVGPATGSGVPVDAATGSPLGLPNVTGGDVRAVAPDGAGGWYVGGTFTHVAGVPRAGLAHILSDHSLSPWNPGAVGAVEALVESGGTVYVGGSFTSIDGQARNRIAAIDAGTGTVTSWNPNASLDVLTLAVAGGTVYAGGNFTFIGGQSRRHIAALDATTGSATVWNPNPNSGGYVHAVAVDGGTVYAGGEFTSIGGLSRSRIAALDGTGAATVWNPGANGTVYALLVDGSTVFAGGQFTNIGGQARSNIAALDATSGAATVWDPAADARVSALALSGSTVYAGGAFANIGGLPRNSIAAIDGSGAATAWDPNAADEVNAVATSGSAVFVGGSFHSMGGQTRNFIAAIDGDTGEATDFNPDADAIVYTLAVKGDVVFAGGAFANIGGQARSHIAALDASTGAALPLWDPVADNLVRALKVDDNTLYVGGDFLNIASQPRSYIAALNSATGSAFPWDPSADNRVYTLAIDGGTVYAGGQFTNIGTQPRNRIAALDAAGAGNALAWNPGANNVVVALAVGGGTVYASGAFTTIGVGSPTRSYIAALDAATGNALPWNPTANSIPYTLVLDGPNVLVGGNFTSIGGQPRDYLAALDAVSGLATPWDPGPRPAGVFAIDVGDDRLFTGGQFNSILDLPHGGFAGIWLAPAFSHLSTDVGGGAGVTTVTAVGGHFMSGATAKLSRAGEPDIDARLVEVSADGLSLTGTFDLAGAALGSWDATFTNPDLQSTTIPDAFTVEASSHYWIHVNILGPTSMRPDRGTVFDVVIQNRGNTDAVFVPLWISGIPAEATVALNFAVTPAPQEGVEPDWSLAPLTLDGPGGQYLALVIPRLPPGVTIRRFFLTVPNTVTEFELGAALTSPWSGRESFGACLAGAGVITAPECIGTPLSALEAYLDATTGIRALSGVGTWAKTAWQCEGAASFEAALADAEQVLDFMVGPIETGVPVSGCEIDLAPWWRARWPVAVVTSLDPNEKVGPVGVGPDRLIGAGQLLPYSVRFENLETASAPAQEVAVMDLLDLATLEDATVSLGPITFAGRSVHPPPGLSNYTAEVDLRPAQPMIVRISAYFDRATGMLSWSMTSLDPATDALPEDPDTGFLPPNLTPPEGEGSLLLTVLSRGQLAGGTKIRNGATILFDGVPLATNEWVNEIDATAPESRVLPLLSTQDSSTFTVRWEAEGSPPDLHDFSVYVSESGGPYRTWRAHVTATADTFSGHGGGSYAFYSLARDSSGNVEPVPLTSDAETTVLVGVGENAPPSFALEGVAPNPVEKEAWVRFTLPGREPATLEVMDVAGRRVWRRDVGDMGPGSHAVDVSDAVRRPGLYFLRLSQRGHVERRRMVVIR